MVINILKIIQNPNTKEYDEISSDVKANDGYCPCLNYKSEDTKCICKEFKDQKEEGFCHCGRYKKILI